MTASVAQPAFDSTATAESATAPPRALIKAYIAAEQSDIDRRRKALEAELADLDDRQARLEIFEARTAERDQPAEDKWVDIETASALVVVTEDALRKAGQRLRSAHRQRPSAGGDTWARHVKRGGVEVWEFQVSALLTKYERRP